MSDAQAIGGQLRAARERAGLSADQAASSLRVDVSVIDSLEAGDFQALGAPVFARGYLRQYATLLGEPPDEVTGRYDGLASALASPDVSDVPHLDSQAGKRHARWPLVVLAVLLLVGMIVWWAMGVQAA
jgi:cytoskeleton protein RodZ